MKFPHTSPTHHLFNLDKLIRSKATNSIFSFLPVTILAGLALSLMLFILPALLNH